VDKQDDDGPEVDGVLLQQMARCRAGRLGKPVHAGYLASITASFDPTETARLANLGYTPSQIEQLLDGTQPEPEQPPRRRGDLAAMEAHMAELAVPVEVASKAVADSALAWARQKLRRNER